MLGVQIVELFWDVRGLSAELSYQRSQTVLDLLLCWTTEIEVEKCEYHTGFFLTSHLDVLNNSGTGRISRAF